MSSLRDFEIVRIAVLPFRSVGRVCGSLAYVQGQGQQERSDHD
jgi:hypothetical protein